MIQTKIITLVTLHFTLTGKDLHIFHKVRDTDKDIYAGNSPYVLHNLHIVTQLYPSTTLVTFALH